PRIAATRNARCVRHLITDPTSIGETILGYSIFCNCGCASHERSRCPFFLKVFQVLSVHVYSTCPFALYWFTLQAYTAMCQRMLRASIGAYGRNLRALAAPVELKQLREAALLANSPAWQQAWQRT
ncbi:MAG TPA: hypothetical protein VMB48_15930, partial [Steroidobacteraceae bacterium]|nr:hypothetical protein [Steroidobacteraceae bacterium]